MKDKIICMPKLELHLHLDGSLDIKKIAQDTFTDINKLYDEMTVSEDCKDLNEYLRKFEYPVSIMQTADELERAMYNLCETLKNQNIIYAEIRFAPAFHTKKGLSQEQVVKHVIDGLKKSKTNYNIILCCMRNLDIKTNLETVDVACKYLSEGVVAIDLAGAEAIYPTENFKYIFDYAKEKQIPYTIHAGEAAGPNSIKNAILFGAKRIGHGVTCINDKQLINEIITKNVILEICPTSNVQTKVVSDIKNHPIYTLYKMGVKTTINTDNMTVSNVDLNKEYIKLAETFNLTLVDFKKMNLNSIEASFLCEKEKDVLRNIINNYY